MGGVLTKPVSPPMVRFPMPDTARRTSDTFDEATDNGRSILFGLLTFDLDVTIFGGNLLATLPKLARRFDVDNGGRTTVMKLCVIDVSMFSFYFNWHIN